MALNQAKTIFVTSVKGGVGKTSTVLNLAGCFESLNKKTLILDIDLYSGGIAASLNIDVDKDLFNIINDMNNNNFTNLNDYIIKYDETIDVIPAPKDPRYASKINSKYLNIVLSKAKMIYDVILIDSNHFMNETNLIIMDNCDTILYVITNDPIDLKNMRTMISIYKDMDKKNYKIVLNNATNKAKNYFTIYDIKHIIGGNIDYIIPATFHIKNYDKYVMDGKILTLDSKIKNIHKKDIEHISKMASSLIIKKRMRNEND